jgi:hypothetical protein
MIERWGDRRLHLLRGNEFSTLDSDNLAAVGVRATKFVYDRRDPWKMYSGSESRDLARSREMKRNFMELTIEEIVFCRFLHHLLVAALTLAFVGPVALSVPMRKWPAVMKGDYEEKPP